jgi:hypothetical protein
MVEVKFLIINKMYQVKKYHLIILLVNKVQDHLEI